MLSHHIDPLDIKLTLIVCSIASSISSKTFIPESFSRSNEFQKLPSSLQRIALRLARILRDERGLTGHQPQWSEQFDAFMRDSSDESPFFIRSIPAKKMSATACLAIMAEELHFNMCKFPSSFVPNEKAGDLEALARANISPQLNFACRHWTEQVSKLKLLPDDLLKRMSLFFETNFLPWLEVVSCFGLHPSEMLQDLSQKRVRDPFDIYSHIADNRSFCVRPQLCPQIWTRLSRPQYCLLRHSPSQSKRVSRTFISAPSPSPPHHNAYSSKPVDPCVGRPCPKMGS